MTDSDQSSSDTVRPTSVKKRPKRERKVWVEMYPGGDAMIEVGNMDYKKELYLQSGEAEALYESLDELLNRTVDPETEQ